MTDDDDQREVRVSYGAALSGPTAFGWSMLGGLLTRLLWKTKRAPRSIRRVLWGVRAEPDEFLD